MARILVVDDAAFMRKMVSDALTKGGHEVVGEAGNGVEAVSRFQELKPELTTLDITMPEKDGLAALKEIIELDPGPPGTLCPPRAQEPKGLERFNPGPPASAANPSKPDPAQEPVAKPSPEASAPGPRP